MYKGCRIKVRCTAGEMEDFKVTVGLHHGSALSPLLFAIMTDCFTKQIQGEAPWDMLFADDVVINAEKIEGRAKAGDVDGCNGKARHESK